MKVKTPCTLLVCWLLLCAPAVGQDKPVIRVGAGLLLDSRPPVTGQLGRDLLTGFLNSRPPSAASTLVQAWPMEAPITDRSIGGEAEHKQYKFVIVTSLVDLSGPPGGKPIVCIHAPYWPQSGNILSSLLNEAGSGLSGGLNQNGCPYELVVDRPISTTPSDTVSKFSVMFKLWKAGDPRPIIEAGQATYLLRAEGDELSPDRISGVAKQIIDRIRRSITNREPPSYYASAATASVAFNLIKVSTTVSVAKGSAPGTRRCRFVSKSV
jgi:hypothetical protein